MIGVAYPRAALRLDRVGKLLLLGPGIGVLAGCGAAPSLTVVGSYFPAWLACGVIGVVAALYLNCFVAVVQAFQKIPAINALAPTQSEPPFLVAQVVVMVIFIALGILAVKKFHPGAASRP